MSTIKDVALHAGVARSTVSRVLNGGSASERARERVMAAVAELDFQPNSIARSLATSRTGSLGMVVSDMEGPFFGSLMKHAEETVRAQGMHLVVTSGHGNAQDEKGAIDFLLDRRCDALLLHVDALPDSELVELAARVPLVVMNRSIPELASQCAYLDNVAGGAQATRYLLAEGHRRIGHISGPMIRQDSRERFEGYRQALAEAGIACEDALVAEGDYHEHSGYHAAQKLLATEPGLTALFCGNDYMAFGAIEALREQGLRVPEDISVVGFDDIVFARYLTPQLTTVKYPVAELGRVAAQMAMKLIGESATGEGQQIQPQLIVRHSAKAASPGCGRCAAR